MRKPKRIFLEPGDLTNLDTKSIDGVVSIIGPTGSGKTKLALQIANQVGRDRTLLVSVDSVALYRGLDIGSAKPMHQERDGYEWIGIDVLNLEQIATSSSYVDMVLPTICQAIEDGKVVVLVGGSHFYERALSIGRMPGEASDDYFQKSLHDQSNEVLHRRLLSRDQKFEDKIHVSDRYRITRYLDLTERQGLSYDQLQTPKDSRPWNKVLTVATAMNDDLDHRTNVLRSRIEAMINMGWVKEVQSILDRGQAPTAPGLQTIGYRDMVQHLLGNISFEEMIERVVISHRQLAKVQRTWVRGLLKKSLNSLDQDNSFE